MKMMDDDEDRLSIWDKILLNDNDDECNVVIDDDSSVNIDYANIGMIIIFCLKYRNIIFEDFGC